MGVRPTPARVIAMTCWLPEAEAVLAQVEGR
jgi:hypothetical protein